MFLLGYESVQPVEHVVDVRDGCGEVEDVVECG
jgi:hypothetical protein